jgi:hypothetical protein
MRLFKLTMLGLLSILAFPLLRWFNDQRRHSVTGLVPAYGSEEASPPILQESGANTFKDRSAIKFSVESEDISIVGMDVNPPEEIVSMAARWLSRLHVPREVVDLTSRSSPH